MEKNIILHDDKRFKIYGYCHQDYQDVLDIFIKIFQNNYDNASQLCCYVENEKIIDIFGYKTNNTFLYNNNSLHNIFSCGKTICSIALMKLINDSSLSYDMTINSVWPEFTGSGKELIKISDLMKHEAGMSVFKQSIPLSDLTSINIKKDMVSNIIEKENPHTPPGKKWEYHTYTRGFILNEIFRRVDSKKRTLKEYLEEEITKPLNLSNNLEIGLSKDLWNLNTPLSVMSIGKTWLDTWYPMNYRFGVPIHSWFFRILLFLYLPFAFLLACFTNDDKSRFVSQDVTFNKETLQQSDIFSYFRSPEWLLAEIPSANIHSNAKSLAVLSNVMVNEGSFIEEGKTIQLFSQNTYNLASKNISSHLILYGWERTHFNDGGWNLYGEKERMGYEGWSGAGGFVMQWHKQYKIAFGYTISKMEISPSAQKAYLLQNKILEITKKKYLSKITDPELLDIVIS